MEENLRIAAVDVSHISRAAWHVGEHKATSFTYQQTVQKVNDIIALGYDRVVVAVDKPPYFRSTLYPEYKQNRGETAHQYYEQLKDILKALDRNGCHIWGVEKFEADDIINELCTRKPDSWKVDIWTGDKDLLQLVDDERGIQWMSVKTGAVVREADVISKYGVHPKEMLDYLSLIGDKSDNIPGLHGCGEKTATAVLSVATLDQILEYAAQGLAIEGMGEKVAERLSDPECIKSIKTGRELIRLAIPEVPEELWQELVSGKKRHVPQEESIVEAEGEVVEESQRGGQMVAVSSEGLSVNALVARVRKVQEIHKIMQRDVHYGIIPGVKKPSLYKAGAELMGMSFQLAPEFEVQKEHDGQHREVTVTCHLVNQVTGKRVGSGMGSCSTRESRYAYRKGERKCPKCGAATIFKSKEGGGFFCWKSKGGCGAQFADKDPAIISQSVDRVDNPDLADNYNTVLKMAIKRAHVSAILFVTCASEIFTQDVEDMPEFAGGQ